MKTKYFTLYFALTCGVGVVWWCRCCAAGEVTVGLASNWPFAVDSVVYLPTHSVTMETWKGRW